MSLFPCLECWGVPCVCQSKTVYDVEKLEIPYHRLVTVSSKTKTVTLHLDIKELKRKDLIYKINRKG